MSVGFFFGIRHSYVREAQASARELLAAVNEVLVSAELAPVEDPEEDPDPRGGGPGMLGRSGTDHHFARALATIGARAGKQRPHTYLLDLNPYRLVYVPRDLRQPRTTRYHEHIAGQRVPINVGSSRYLLDELLTLAPELGIPLTDGALSDDVARRIDNLDLFAPNEDPDLVENERTAWLLLHETARLSVELDVPLSLAG